MCVLGLRILSSRGSELSSIILDLERWLIYQTMGFSGRRIHFRSQIEDQERGGVFTLFSLTSIILDLERWLIYQTMGFWGIESILKVKLIIKEEHFSLMNFIIFKYQNRCIAKVLQFSTTFNRESNLLMTRLAITEQKLTVQVFLKRFNQH